jgi:hypothetical protein
MLQLVERKMALRFSDYRFWVLFSALAMGLLIACSSDDSTGGNTTDSGSEHVGDSMTKG